MSFRFDNPTPFVSLEEIEAAQEIINRQKKQELNKAKHLLRDLKHKTSIPKDQWVIHKSHCCFEHGCKYGDKDCPVELAIIDQNYPCEEYNT